MFNLIFLNIIYNFLSLSLFLFHILDILLNVTRFNLTDNLEWE